MTPTEFLVFEPREPFGPAFLYSLFRSEPFRATMRGMVTGTSKGHRRLSPKALRAHTILRPPDGVAEACESVAWPLLARIPHGRAENRTLAATRDLLLPRLMSGELRVGEVREMAEDAA